MFLEIKCKIVQASECDLKYDAGAAADVIKTDAPYFCNNVSYSEITVYRNYAHKSFIETEYSHNKDTKAAGLACQGYSYEDIPGAIPAAEVKRRQAMVRHSAECTFYGKVAVIFFYL